MTEPIDVATGATAAFIAAHLPARASVLEVGCGEGHVAVELLKRGHHVVGVDSDAEAVARARERGVFALHATWPDCETALVDAVAFTRSLHHVSPLRKAVVKAREVSKPTGKLLVEDFAFDEADERTIDWFLDVLGSRAGNALIAPVAGQLVTDLLDSKDPVAAWHRSHDHDLHTMASMARAIEECFIVRETRMVPYLYRYLAPVLPKTLAALEFTEDVYREEAALGERGEVVLVGRRTVGSPREA